jgi:tetrahydromethanopterin S-methyltransferase subunit G/predicted small secreted protein
MALYSGKLAYRQQNNIPVISKDDKSKLGYVYDVILDNSDINDITFELDDSEFKNVSIIGAVRFRFGSDTVSSPSELSIAFPFDKNFVNLPLKNETVEIYKGNGSQFFYRRIGRDVTPNFNSSESLVKDSFIKSNSTESTSNDYKRVQETGITKTNNDTSNKYDGYGDYFTTDNTIHKLKLYEGDTLIQSRFGQSIRFSGFNNDVQRQSPTIIIRNDESSFSKKKNIDEVVEEDVNRDGSVIVLGSNQYQLPFQPGTVSDGGTSDFETKPDSFANFPSKLIGDQILINSGRLIFSAKNAEMIFYSKKNYGFISDGAMSIDNKLGIDVSVGANVNIVTNDRDILMYTGNGSIFLGNTALEPIVKGQQLVNILSELIDAIAAQTFLTPSGPTAEGPVNVADFGSIKSRLNDILSKLNQTS